MSFARYRYLIFVLLGTAYLLVFFHRLAPAVVAVDMMADLQTGGALMGLLASAYFYPYALMQIPAGLLSDTWGPRRSVVAFFSVAAAGSILLGFTQNVTMAITARVLVGLGVAMVFIPTLKILTRWFEAHEFSRMTSLLMSLGGVGAFTASTPLAFLSDAITWRGSMIVIGVATLAISALIWRLVRDTPEQSGYRPLTNCAIDNTCDGVKYGLLGGIFLVLKNKIFWPMALCNFFGALVTLSFNGLWGGPFLMHAYGLSRTQAGGVLSMMAVGLIFGAPFWNWLSHQVLYSRKKVLLISQFSGLCLFAPLAFFTAGFSVPQLYLWCFFFNFSMCSMVVVGYSAIKESFPLQISGTATGVLNIFPFAGAALGQPLIGWYLDSAGAIGGRYPVEAYSGAFKMCLISLVVAFFCSTLVRETLPPKTPGPKTVL